MVAQIDSRFIKRSLKKSFTRYLSYALYEGRPLTTKGRWINPLIFALYRLQVILPLAKPVVRPIFILGTGRSGTTILGVTLGMHRDVGFLNEPKALWSYLFDEEDLIGSYKEIPGRYRLAAADVVASMIKKAHRIYGNYLRFGFATRIVDKYPELIFRTEFVTKIFPDARFIFLFRDGRATCHSIGAWSERLGTEDYGGKRDWWGRDDRKWRLLCEQIVAFDSVLGPFVEEISGYKNHEQRAAVEWIVTMKEGLALLASNPEFIYGLKYEDYVGNSAVRHKILRFCDLPPDLLYDQYCTDVLNTPKARPELDLPLELKDEFLRVMAQLGYE